MAAAFFASILVSLNLMAAPGLLDGYSEEPVRTGTLCFKGVPQEERDRISRELSAALVESEKRLERTVGHPFKTVLVPSWPELDRIAGRLGVDLENPDAILGLALPELRLLLVRGDPIPGTRGLRTTLAHEVAHLVIHRKPDAAIPRWLDEGAAMWVSGALLSPDEEAYLSFLARIGALYPIRKLHYRFPPGRETTSTAYHQSCLLVAYLVERFGESSVPRLLDLVEGGADGARALQEVTGDSVERLEERFERWVAARQPFLAAVASIANVWTVTSMLAVVAIALEWVRRRRRLRALEADTEAGETESEDRESGETESGKTESWSTESGKRESRDRESRERESRERESRERESRERESSEREREEAGGTDRESKEEESRLAGSKGALESNHDQATI